MHRLGRFELHAVGDGSFLLDGGAMFGIVPKTVWEKIVKPDAKNRVVVKLNPLLIRTGEKNILVDTGIGDKYDAKFSDLYEPDRSSTLLRSLRGIGLGPEDIDVVILTHLHFDHAGGATLRRGGEAVPAFPRAEHVLQEGMWEEAFSANPRSRGSYVRDDFGPLKKAGLVKFVRGEAEVAPGVRVLHSGGHVEHHQMVMIESGGRKALHWGDVMPTSAHVKPAWATGYDLFPLKVAELRETLGERSAAEGWLNVFGHDPFAPFGYLRKGEKGLQVETVESGLGGR
jgi:glyoxylase-like metal-dependent hydrolase (beta-lactamase superfamily II)